MEPLEVDEVKRFLRIPDSYTADDEQIEGLITAAREQLEGDTGRQFITATWDYTLDSFPCRDREPIKLPRPPLQTVTSVTYLDSAGVSQVWANTDYTVKAPAGPLARPGTLFPKVGKTYPDTADIAGAVTIRFVAGHVLLAVPRIVKGTLLMLIADMYGFREGMITGTIVSANPALTRNINRLRGQVYA